MFSLSRTLILTTAMIFSLYVPPRAVLADSSGLFISAAANYGQIDDDFTLEDQDDLKAFFDDKSTGFNGGVGWRFNKWLSVDVGYWDFGTFKSDALGNGQKAEIETTTYTAGAMVSVPLWIIDVYGRAGVAQWDADAKEAADADDDGTDAYYGVGAAINVFSSLDIYLEVVRFDLQTDVDTANLGLRFTF